MEFIPEDKREKRLLQTKIFQKNLETMRGQTTRPLVDDQNQTGIAEESRR
jgi:hypothetical protein